MDRSKSSYRSRQSRTLASNPLDLIHECIMAGLPSNCSADYAVRSALECACKLDAIVGDEAALRVLCRFVLASEVLTESGALRERLSGGPLRESLARLRNDIGSRPDEEAPPTPKGTNKKAKQTNTENGNAFLSHGELAKRWGLSTMTLRRWRRDGRLHGYHFGRQVRFKLAEILDYERQARV